MFDYSKIDDFSTDLEIVTSPGEIKRFIESTLYQDFLNELNLRDHYLMGLLRDPELKQTGRDYDQIRGGLNDLDHMKLIFSGMLENKEGDLQMIKEEQDRQDLQDDEEEPDDS